MSKTPKSNGDTKNAASRDDRLADALRNNLRRRKDQARQRKTSEQDDEAPRKPTTKQTPT